MKIYFDTIGYRCPLKDKDQIMWFFTQTAKTKSKGNATKYWLDLMEHYAETFKKCEAFELLHFLKQHATDARIKRRESYRKKAKKDAELEMNNMEIFLDQWRIKRELINLIRLN